jgi:osmotically-inducible protein OsmY
MKTDAQIQKDVMDELKWDPSVTHEHIGVAVNDGIVTLSGHVPTYFEKSAAQKATHRVEGVKAVAEQIEVRYPGSYVRDDEEIAKAILGALKWSVQVPEERIQVRVSKGWVTLGGEVEWEYQKEAAENAIKPLVGVLGISNYVSIRPQVQVTDVKSKIEQALKRAAERETNRIKVAVEGQKVTLTGKVRSYAELVDARGAAWSAPGVTEVVDHLIVAA